EDDQPEGEGRSKGPEIGAIQVEQGDQDDDARRCEDEVDHPQRPESHATSAKRRPRPYLFCPQPRADPIPNLQEVFEVDLKSRRERVQDPVAFAPEGHHEVVLVEHIEVMANRLVVQRELRGEVVRVVRPVVEDPQNPCAGTRGDRKSTRLNSSHEWISYAVFCLKKKTNKANEMKTTDHLSTH